MIPGAWITLPLRLFWKEEEDPERECECEKDVCDIKSVLGGNKDVLVYFDLVISGSAILPHFVSWYNSLGEKEKEKRLNNLEVVCVYMSIPRNELWRIRSRRQFPKWLIRSVDEKPHRQYLSDNFFRKLFKHVFSTLVAFGKDGKISSLCAHRLLSSDKDVTFPLKGDLSEEVVSILNDYFTKTTSRD